MTTLTFNGYAPAGTTPLVFTSALLSGFNSATMQLTLNSPTSISFKSGLFSGSLKGSFEFNASGDIVGGSITTFMMTYAPTYSFTFSDLNLSVVDFTNTLVTQGAQALYQQTLAGDDKIVGYTYGEDRTRFVEGFGGNDTIGSSSGHDTIYGGSGDDRIFNTYDGTAYYRVTTYLRGDDGNDTISGGSGFDDINGNKGDDVCSGHDGADWVVGGQGNDLLFGDHDPFDGHGYTAFNEPNDIVYGNLGNDTCYGGEGNDVVRGGQGDDVLYGDKGDDWLAGDRGSDTITGGAGADVFYGFSGISRDYVTDFSRAQGDRVQLALGTAYTLRQDGANAVVDLGNGDQIVLAGVQTSSLSGDWLFFA